MARVFQRSTPVTDGSRSELSRGLRETRDNGRHQTTAVEQQASTGATSRHQPTALYGPLKAAAFSSAVPPAYADSA